MSVSDTGKVGFLARSSVRTIHAVYSGYQPRFHQGGLFLHDFHDTHLAQIPNPEPIIPPFLTGKPYADWHWSGIGHRQQHCQIQ